MKLFEDGDPCFAPMLNALFAAFRGTAVMSGCEVSATGTSRTVSITAGSVQINGEVIAVSAGSVTLDAGSTFDRYDLVSVNASGSKIVTKGTTKRKCPTQPANTCLLAIVFVPAGATVIATGNVYDARMLSPNLAAAAIECAGAIRNQTGNIGARSQFVDVPGSTLRVSDSVSISATKDTWVTVKEYQLPSSYCSVTKSNFTVSVSASISDHRTDQILRIRVLAGDTEIGEDGSGGYEIGGASCNTTGGIVQGQTLRIEVLWNPGQYAPNATCTVTGVQIRSTRSTTAPAYKRVPEGGMW